MTPSCRWKNSDTRVGKNFTVIFQNYWYSTHCFGVDNLSDQCYTAIHPEIMVLHHLIRKTPGLSVLKKYQQHTARTENCSYSDNFGVTTEISSIKILIVSDKARIIINTHSVFLATPERHRI